jgi:large subunit ribosomal protein L32e
MTTKENLLKQRKMLKRRKPIFLRKDWHKMYVLGYRSKKKQKWRKASGRHNKIREKVAGQQKMPSIGYRSPRLVRGTIHGQIPMLINNKNELKKITAESIAIIASNVGKKKRIEIAEEAKKLGISIHNISKKNKIEKTGEEKK